MSISVKGSISQPRSLELSRVTFILAVFIGLHVKSLLDPYVVLCQTMVSIGQSHSGVLDFWNLGLYEIASVNANLYYKSRLYLDFKVNFVLERHV